MVSPRECTRPDRADADPGDLHRQRLRWYRGAIENLRSTAGRRSPRATGSSRLGLLLCTLLFGLFVAVTAIDRRCGLIRWSPWWSAVSLLFLVERMVTVWRVGTRRGRLLALAVVPEIAYDLFLQATFVRAGVHVLRRSEAHWSHGSGSPHTAHRTPTSTSPRRGIHVPARPGRSRDQVSAAAGTGGLAFTGLNTAHYLVAAATLIMLGVVLLTSCPGTSRDQPGPVR